MSSTQLTYTLNTTPGPLTAGLTDAIITFTARNATTSSVSLQGISIQIPIGSAPNDLTNNPAQINVIAPVGWQQDKANQTGGSYTFVFTPVTTPALVNPNDSLVFTFSNIQLNNAAGASAITITEGSEGNPTQELSVSVFPGGWGSIIFTASPSYLSEEGNVTLSWNGPSGATYQLQYIELATGVTTPIQATLSNYGTYPGEGQPALTISETTLFILTVTAVIDGTTVTATPQVIVPVAEQLPVINSFTGNVAIVNGALTLQLNWTTTNAINVQGSWTDNVLDANPSQPVSILPPFNEQYQITAVGQNGYTSSPMVLTKEWQNLMSLSLPFQDALIISTTPNGNLALVGSNSGSVAIINLNNLSAEIAVIQVCPNQIYSINFDPLSEYAYLTDNTDTVYVLSLNNLNAPIQTINLSFAADMLTITPNGAMLIIGGDSNLAICDTYSLSNLTTITLEYPPAYFTCTPDSRYVVVSTNSGYSQPGGTLPFVLYVFDLENSFSPKTVNLGNHFGVGALSLSPDGQFAYILFNKTIQVINLQNLSAPPQIISIDGPPLQMVFIQSGNKALTANSDSGTVSVIDTGTMQVTKTIVAGNLPEAIYLSTDENYAFIFLSDSTEVAVIDLNNFALAQNLLIDQQVYGLVYCNSMLLALSDASVSILAPVYVSPQTNTWSKVATIAAPNAAPLGLSITYDNRLLTLLQEGGNMVLIDINQLAAVTLNSPTTSSTNCLCNQPGEKGCYVSDSVANTITNYLTTSTGFSSNQTYQLNFSPCALAVSTDGSILAAISEVTNSVAIMNMNENNTVQYVSLATIPTALTVTSNGRYVITGNQPSNGPNSISVIDTTNISAGAQTFNYGNTQGVVGLAVSPNNQYVLATSYNQVAALSLTSLGTPPDIIQVGNAAIFVCFTPSGDHAYVSNVTDGTVSVIDMGNLNIAPQTITLGNEPEFICITPDGKFAFITLDENNTVAILDLQYADNPPQIIQLSTWTQFIVASYDSRYVFIANQDGTVDIFSSSRSSG